MHQKKIKTYQATEFREKFISKSHESNDLLGSGFGMFFIAKVEDMLSFIKLPVPAVKTTTSSFIFLSEGTANISIGAEHYLIKKNEVIFVPSGQVFSFGNRDINQGYFCNYHPDFILSDLMQNSIPHRFGFLDKWSNPKVELNEVAEFCLQLLVRMHQEYQQNKLSRKPILQSYLYALICEINGAYQQLNNTEKNKLTELPRRFKELLDQNIRKLHSPQEYASLLNVSPNHLNKVLKKSTHKTTKSWIQETLIIEAKVLLCQTDLSVKEIAFDLGFLDTSYFSRAFKKLTHLSPAEYRKMIENS